jgi:hypothetical protein
VETDPVTFRPARRALLLAVCLFSAIAGARWAIFDRYGTDLPEWDQWDAEWQAIVVPWSQGHLHAADFLQPHNEHRIVLARLAAFALTCANGQWDQRWEALCVALLPAAIAASLWLLAGPRLSKPWGISFYLLLLAVYCLPLAWQNMLSGFAFPQFFLIGLALAGLWTLPFAEPFAPAWWAGSASIVLSLGALASGFFAAAVVLLILCLQRLSKERSLAKIAPALAVCLLTIAVGILTRTAFPGHDSLKAANASDFFWTTAKAIGWPAFDLNWGLCSLALFAPWATVAFFALKEAGRSDPHPRWTRFLAGAGVWVVLQALAAAYARGAGGPSPASRYVDTLIVGVIVNFLCLHGLWQRAAFRPRARDMLAIFIGGWALLVTAGLAGETKLSWDQISPFPAYHRACEEHVRGYLVTGDESYLRHPEIPYPAEWTMKYDLDLAAKVNRLPASVRRPLPLAPAGSGPARGFVRWDARSAEGHVPPVLARSGLSPATAALPNEVTWGCYGTELPAHGPAQWSSRPFHVAEGKWLEFEVAGGIGRPGTALEVGDAASGKVVATVLPSGIPGDRWLPAQVWLSSGDFVIRASCDDRTTWFAFAEPVEMSRLSHWAWQLSRRGGMVAALAACFAAGIAVLPRRKP